jgi:hypothetical protein
MPSKEGSTITRTESSRGSSPRSGVEDDAEPQGCLELPGGSVLHVFLWSVAVLEACRTVLFLLGGVLFLAGAILGLRQESSQLGAVLYVPCACCYLLASCFDVILYFVTRTFLRKVGPLKKEPPSAAAV